MALKLNLHQQETFFKTNKKELTNICKQKPLEYKGEMIDTHANQNIISVDLAYSKGTQKYICNNTCTLSFTYSSNCPVTMATYCPQYIAQATYTVPVIINKWNPLVTAVPTPVYSTLIPQVSFIANSHIIPTQLCPYTGAIITEPLISPPVPKAIIPEPVSGLLENFYKPIESYVEPEQTIYGHSNFVNDQIYYKSIEDIVTDDAVITGHEDINNTKDPLQLYLNLPRELFPSARRLALDPNPIIDEFCKHSNIEDHAAWILDLEFGIPKVAITRAIPVYDVKFNSIHCKNTPSAIHPGFESCNENFKRVLLFYYDCIVSAWYRGYVIVNNDGSVENFQAWLLIAMQFFGMCWP